MKGVISTGNMVLDILVRPVELAEDWAGTTMVESIEQSLGGNGANTSYTLARLGVPVRLLGMAGTDPFGEYVVGRLREAGVDTGGIRRSAAPTATTVVLVNDRGDRRFLHRLGSSAEVSLDPGEFERQIQPEMAHYHMASPFTLPRLRAVNAELLRRARGCGLTTSVDTQWDWQGRWMEDLGPCLPHVDVLFVNQDEARMLAGTTEPAKVAKFFRDCGARTIVFKLGGEGCAVFTPETEFRAPGFQVPVVDTTGAGDCFAGGYLAALLRGASHQQAARFANGVAAMAIQRLGSVDGVRSFEETQTWIAGRGDV